MENNGMGIKTWCVNYPLKGRHSKDAGSFRQAGIETSLFSTPKLPLLMWSTTVREWRSPPCPPLHRRTSVRICKVEGGCKTWKRHTKQLCAQKYLESRFLIRARTSLYYINNNVEHMLPRLFARHKNEQSARFCKSGRHVPWRDSCSCSAVAAWWLDLRNSDYLSTCTWPRRNIKITIEVTTNQPIGKPPVTTIAISLEDTNITRNKWNGHLETILWFFHFPKTWAPLRLGDFFEATAQDTHKTGK